MTFRLDALKFACFTLLCLLLQQQTMPACRAEETKDSQSAPVRRQLKIPVEPTTPRRARVPRQPQTVSNVLLIMPADEELRSLKSKTAEPTATASSSGKTTGSARSGVTNYGPGASKMAQTGSNKASKTKPTKTDDTEEGETEDLISAIRGMGGQVVDTIGKGSLTVWVVKFDTTERFLKAEKQLTNDTRVKNLQRDYIYKTNLVDPSLVAITPTDPYYSSEWYFDALNVLPAWKLSKGSSNVIGVVDSGTNGKIEDLKDKCLTGYDAITEQDGQVDVQGHGTMVATTAAATANNGTGTAGPATRSKIYPVRVGYATGVVSVSAIVKGIEKCGDQGVKIINISSNGDPPYTFANRTYNHVLHHYLRWFHDEKGGLVFNSAGNSGTKDLAEMRRYLIVVSAIDESYSLAYFSTFGTPVWFTAPGTNIVCTEKDDNVVSVSGTSFSSPLCASIAALVWGANPSLTNLEVEQILKDTCYKAGNRHWTKFFGFGMPNAEAAVQAALGK